VEFGLFDEITALNPRFIAGHERLKLTMEVRLPAFATAIPTAGFVQSLEQLFPGLALHRCCGENKLHETLFNPLIENDRHSDDAVRQPDDFVDVAHLFEHLVIDFQHAIANMGACSGITCGYETPRSRYDIFVESPARGVSELCVGMAWVLMNELMRGRTPDAVYAGVVKLARWFHMHPGNRASSASAARFLHGDARARDTMRVLSFLHDMGFIAEIESSMNFSRTPVYELA